MEFIVLHMTVLDVQHDCYTLEIEGMEQKTKLYYFHSRDEMTCVSENNLCQCLLDNRGQIRKILNNRKGHAIKSGFQLRFVLSNNKDVAAFNDPSNIIVWDNQNDDLRIYPTKIKKTSATKIFIDGCYLPKKERAGYAFIIQAPGKKESIYSKPCAPQNSCLVELLPAIEALKICHDTNIRFISDSVYVRKGLTEWLPNWERNNWLTANGEPARNQKEWKEFKALAGKRCIEFEWVKGHRDHPQNILCDRLAKEAALGDISGERINKNLNQSIKKSQ